MSDAVLAWIFIMLFVMFTGTSTYVSWTTARTRNARERRIEAYHVRRAERLSRHTL